MSMLPSLTTIECGDGKTKQKVGVEHDINKLVARFKKDGKMPNLNYSLQNESFDVDGVAVDITDIGDFQDCQNRIIKAEQMFMQYPSTIRRRFNNDTKIFTDFIQKLNTKESIDEAVRMGLLTLTKPAKPEQKEPKAN